MKKLLLLSLCLAPLISSGQAYLVKLEEGSKIKLIGIKGILEIEGTNSDSLLIVPRSQWVARRTQRNSQETVPDNTGIGLNAVSVKNEVTVTPAGDRMQAGNYLVKVPKKSTIYVSDGVAADGAGPGQAEDKDSVKATGIYLENILGEIEINSMSSPVSLVGITGPVTVYAMKGDIKAEYIDLSREGVHSFETIDGNIHIQVPRHSEYQPVVRNTSIQGWKPASKEIRNKATGKGSKIIVGSMNGVIDLREKQ